MAEQSTAASQPALGLGSVARVWDAGSGVKGLGGTAQPQRQGALALWLPAHGVAVPKSPSAPCVSPPGHGSAALGGSQAGWLSQV